MSRNVINTDNKARRRRGEESMTERRRGFSPKYHPLTGEEGEPPESLGSPVHSRRGNGSGSSRSGSGQPDRQDESVERVIILSDREEDTVNGDADSGISLTEVVGEEHPVSGRANLLGRGEKQESLVVLVIQIVIPFFFAGFGMMAAGLLLDAVQVNTDIWPPPLHCLRRSIKT